MKHDTALLELIEAIKVTEQAIVSLKQGRVRKAKRTRHSDKRTLRLKELCA